jgi:hypothetical protein
MQLATFFKVHAVIALLFGMGFVLMPATILAFYTTVPVNEIGAFMSRLFGSAILTYAAVLWLASDAPDSPARWAIVQGFFLSMIVGVAVVVHFQLTGPINALGWTTVLLYVFLAVSYGAFHFSQNRN